MMFLKIFKGSFLFFFGVFFFLTFVLSLHSIFHPGKKILSPIKKSTNKKLSPPTSSELEALRKKFGRNKIIPVEVEAAVLQALSYFPELKESEITFVTQPALFPLSSRPDPVSMIVPWDKIFYTVVISTESTPANKLILLNNLSFNAQVGVLGHELAHISEYLSRNSLEMAWLGIRYASSFSYRKKIERKTDALTICHGLGYQLLDWRLYLEGLIHEDRFSPQQQKLYFEADRYLNSSGITLKIADKNSCH